MGRAGALRALVLGVVGAGALTLAGFPAAGGSQAAPGEGILAEGVGIASTASAAERQRIDAIRRAAAGAAGAGEIVVDYPLAGSVLPPDMIAPRLLWHDSSDADLWLVEVSLAHGKRVLALTTAAAPQPGAIDPRALGATNEVYRPTPDQATSRSWEPPDDAWPAIRDASVGQTLAVTILGVRASAPEVIRSRGRLTLAVSKDPVGAPIFYRDVPLMPSKTEKNVIKPLADQALPLIQWRLRSVSRRDSRVVLENMPTCANCHSFSRDGQRLGMDIDGPDGDKGAYTIAPVRPRMSITRDTLISWNSYKDKPKTQRTIGFLSQIAPDGRHVVTTLNEELYVSNFTSYRFIQVFYPTRGILAYYSSASDEIKALPGADDAAYVHCDPAWSPDGRTIVFARARARDSYAKDVPLAAYPNDPKETPMQYDLYRMPFDEGRGGRPVPVAGASANGMSNSFPKVTPDGRFIVFVKAKNGQLLRPDSELWIVPFEGGEAHRMECNTPLMNSWHSFNPSGRWMVFSSKANTPYTQLFLTHLDEAGRSTPPILVPESTAANRAANIPEFVNVAYDGLQTIQAPSVDHYLGYNRALELLKESRFDEAVASLENALTLEPESVKTHLLLGTALWRTGRAEPAIAHYEKAVALDPARAEAHYSLSFALFLQERYAQAAARFRDGYAVQPRSGRLPEPYDGGIALSLPELPATAIETARMRLAQAPNETSSVSALLVLASLRAAAADPALRDGQEALQLARRACALTRYQMPEAIDVLAGASAEAGRLEDAVQLADFALWLARAADRTALVPGLEQRLALYRQGKPFRRAN